MTTTTHETQITIDPEVRPSERIVQTFTFEGFPDSVSLEKLDELLAELG